MFIGGVKKKLNTLQQQVWGRASQGQNLQVISFGMRSRLRPCLVDEGIDEIYL